MVMKKILLLALVVVALISKAQNPKLIKTVQGFAFEPNNDKQESWINNKWNGLFFYQGKGTPTKLCVTDGTDIGTKNIADIGSGGIQAILPAKDFVYIITSQFISFSPYTYQYSIYKTDGTAAGTSLVFTPPNAIGLSNANQFCSDANTTQNYCLDGTTNILYFNGYDATNGNELWRTDGTAAGTFMLKDIKTGTGGSYPWGFCKIGNDVFFNCAEVGFERKLWKTDGTTAGTVQVPVAEPFYIVNGDIGKVGNKMIFYAHNTVNGYETYVSDGTAAGTFMLKDINPSSGNSYLNNKQEVTLKSNSKYCFFVAQNGVDTSLWRTDGTTLGTIKLTNGESVYNGVSSGGYSDVNENGLWLIQYNTSGSGNAEKLFFTDGTIGNTYLVASNLSYAQKVKIYKNAAWFQARNTGSVANVEVWRSAGNQASTNLALDVAPEIAPSPSNIPYSSTPINFFVNNNKLYFFAKTWLGNMGLYEYNGDFTFNGSLAGGRWKDSANWNSMMPPGITDTVFINTGTPNALNINGSNAYAGVLQMGNNATLNLTNTTDSLFINNKLSSNSNNSFTGNGVVVAKNIGADSVQLTNSFSANNLLIQSNTNLQAGTIIINNQLTLNNNGKLILNNNNTVLSGNTSTATGSISSYIVTNGTGKLSVENIGAGARTGTVNFPIGTSENYNPIAFTNSGVADNFSARVQPTVYENYIGEIGTGAIYASGIVHANWFITEAVAGGSNAQISFQWNGNQEANSFDKNTTAVGHYTSGSWNLGSIGSATGSNPYTYSRAGITSFSPFAIMNNNAIVPMQSIKLSVIKTSNSNKLNWNIIATDAAQIEIQKSNNGINFLSINKQVFIANGYYNDDRIIGKNYYRLKVVDKNGSYSYSNIVVVDDKATINVQVYPSVFNQSFTVQNNTNQKLQLQLIDITGKQLLQQSLFTGTNIIDTKQIITGILFYQIASENNIIQTGKIIKQ